MDDTISFKDDFYCINCGKQSFLLRYEGFDRLYGIPGEFNILECANCGLFSISPKLLPEDIVPYYPENYLCFLKAVEDETNLFRYLDRWRARERKVKQILRHVDTQGRILDVGCATGILLSGMQRYGWDCYGVEPDLNAAEYARNRFGLEVFYGQLEDAEFPDHYFDVVTMIDVFEHIYDPLMAMKEVLRILKPGGHFIGNIPNADAWERFLFGSYWAGWDVPRHYHVFTQRTISQLLETHGFTDVELFSFTGRHGTFMISMQSCLDVNFESEVLKKFIISIIGSLPFRFLILPYFIIVERLNKNSYLSFSARKVI